MITRAHVMPYLNQHVVVRTTDGAIHHGILHSVTNDGIYMRRLGGNIRAVSGQGEQAGSVELLVDLPESDGVEQTWFPFFFLPWLAIGAFWPWFWW